MPYIIITRTTRFQNAQRPPFSESRTAVATLTDARAKAQDLQGEAVTPETLQAAWSLPESGGSINLPDGTVIEVRPASWMDLKIHTDLPGDPHGTLPDATILAAFNGAHA